MFRVKKVRKEKRNHEETSTVYNGNLNVDLPQKTGDPVQLDDEDSDWEENESALNSSARAAADD